MSLFGTLQIAANALQAQQIGLQVVGQNIANANTPGYSREEVVFTPAPTQRVGTLQLGLGVQVQGIIQKVDTFLNERLRGATSDKANSETQEQTYTQLESIIGELQDNDLSSSLNRFFSSISEILNQPESVSVRNLAVLQGRTLAVEVNNLAKRVADLRGALNQRVANSVPDINSYVDQISKLNVQIATTEGGSAGVSTAVGLRDQRSQLLTKLAQLTNIRVDEQPSGAVNVFVGGDYLVFEGTVRHLKAVTLSDRGLSATQLRLSDTNSPLESTSGELVGLINSRDQVLGGFLDKLDGLASTLAFEFNKVYSSGQGLTGYQSLTSEFPIANANVPLDAAGLKFTPVNGSFQIQVHDRQTDQTLTTEIPIDLNGLDGDDTTLNALVARLNGVNGLAASVTSDGRIQLNSTSSNLEFAFNNDTSGVLAALGLNTFFSGSTARDLAISSVVAQDPTKFAASRSGIRGDTANALSLATFIDRPLSTSGGATLGVLYDRLTAEATQGSAVSHAVAEGFRTFYETLNRQQLAVSGVSLDEEAVRMLSFQRTYQASARLISTLADLLDTLIKL